MFQYSCSQTIQELTLNVIYPQGFSESKVLAVSKLSPLPTKAKANHIESLDLLRSMGREKRICPPKANDCQQKYSAALGRRCLRSLVFMHCYVGSISCSYSQSDPPRPEGCNWALHCQRETATSEMRTDLLNSSGELSGVLGSGAFYLTL